MLEDIDWSHRAEYMFAKHGVTVQQATEAVRDPERVVLNPDYNSQSGKSIRVIGYSQTRETLLSIIVVHEDGETFGVNGWDSNPKDRNIYNEGTE